MPLDPGKMQVSMSLLTCAMFNLSASADKVLVVALIPNISFVQNLH